MRKLLEAKMDQAVVGGLEEKMKRKAESWSAAPQLRFDKLTSKEQALIKKLPKREHSRVYSEWPTSPAIADFYEKPGAEVFILLGPDKATYLVSAAGYNYARYVGRLLGFH